MYQVEFTNRAIKNLKKIDSKYQYLIIEKLENLAKSPENATNIKHLIGTKYNRLRVADYRIIYELQNDELIVLVIDINHRKDIY
jgi:mRNA interferase RelE/StbE